MKNISQAVTNLMKTLPYGIVYLVCGVLIALIAIVENMTAIDIATWIIAISGTVAASTIAVYYAQYKSDHERSRREKAVDLILEWSKNLNEKSSIARKFAETLDAQKSLSLFKQEPFEIDSKSLELFFGYIGKKKEEGNDKYKLTFEEVTKVRWDVIKYLNVLESILSAWRHNIADNEMIREQFKYLVKPSEGHDVLKEFRKAAENSYPAIDEFVSKLENNENKEGKEKIA